MTRMQIIAKTVLTILGIYIVLAMCQLYLTRYLGPVVKIPTLEQIMFCTGFTTLIVFVVYLMVFNNNSLARMIAGPGEEIDIQAQIGWLTKSLRTGFVFTGLILLPDLMPGRPSPHEPLIKTAFWVTRALLSIYLLCGAPHFVRWQIRRSLRQIVNPKQAEYPDFSAKNPERTTDE